VKILAIKWRRLGDTVLWTASLDALRQFYPHAEIDIAFPAPYTPLFEGHSSFQTLFPLKSDKTTLSRFTSAWIARQYDLVVCFHASDSLRRLARQANGKKTLIHHHSRKGLRFGSDLPIVSAGKPMNAIERDLNVLRTLGWNGKNPGTRVHCTTPWKERALRQMAESGSDPRRPILILSPGASRLSKRWPLQHYASVAEKLSASHQVIVLAETMETLGPDTLAVARLKNVAQLVFTPLLEDAIGMLALAQTYLGSDSGLKHLAAALGVPTFTLFGPESVGEWHPYDPSKHSALRNRVECRFEDKDNPEFAWCGEEVCPLASHACMALTRPDEVIAAIEGAR
jgi:ADP-heptose:LPS heptosyltransferase